jgi:phosphoglycolate phosphatase-like HAD superfamily hydrolase
VESLTAGDSALLATSTMTRSANAGSCSSSRGRPASGSSRALDELDVDPDRAVVVGVDEVDLEAAREAGAALVIGIARGKSTPEQLRRAGADTLVADLQELLGST